MYYYKKIIALLLFSILLGGCVVGPDYRRPNTVVPARYKEAKGKKVIGAKRKGWKIANPCDDINRGEWWTVFNDPLLNELENQLNTFNQNIANAIANYRQAKAIVDEARAAFFPTMTAALSIFRQLTGNGTTSFISTSGGVTSTGTATTGVPTGLSRISTLYNWILNASWEPDIWGQVRRTVESDTAAAQASAALIAVTRLSAQGALAQYYFELRALDTDQKLLNDTVVSYKKILQLTINQYNSGVASRADVVQAQSQLEIAQAQAINNGILRGQYEHAIAVLLGRPPGLFSLKFRPLCATPPPIPLEVPTALLERRPDIAQAERLMQQANALIGVAIAAYYPALTLSATASGTGTSLSKLFHQPAIGWAYGLQVAETIFDGGLRAATVRAARAAYEAQVASYRQTVLTAFQDVEDNLIALRILKEQGIVQNQAAASAKLALKLVINQYKSGTVPYSSVLTSQITAYSAQKAAYDVVGLQMTSAVGLIKALGGGWNVHEIDCAGC